MTSTFRIVRVSDQFYPDYLVVELSTEGLENPNEDAILLLGGHLQDGRAKQLDGDFLGYPCKVITEPRERYSSGTYWVAFLWALAPKADPAIGQYFNCWHLDDLRGLCISRGIELVHGNMD